MIIVYKRHGRVMVGEMVGVGPRQTIAVREVGRQYSGVEIVQSRFVLLMFSTEYGEVRGWRG